MISFVCWKWSDPRAGRTFTARHVNVLAQAVDHYYPKPHRFVCVTDDPVGLAADVTHVPMPRTGFEHLINPSEIERARPRHIAHFPARRMGRRYVGGQPLRDPPAVDLPPRRREPKPFPSCYRRLWNFSRAARERLGDRIFALDIDVVVMGDLRPLVARTSTFVGWCDPHFERNKVAGGAYMLTTGAHPEVYDEFDPERSPAIAQAAGFSGSDQAWMSYKLSPPHESWSPEDGLVKLKWLRPGERAPGGTRLIFTSGDRPPWHPETQTRYPWIAEYWR